VTSSGHVVTNNGHVVTNSGHEVTTKEEPIKKNYRKKNHVRKGRTPLFSEEVEIEGVEIDSVEIDSVEIEGGEGETPPQPSPDRGGGSSPQSPQQAIFGAICAVLGWDWRTIDGRDKGRVAEAGRILAEAGYGERDIYAFLTEVWFHDWRWTKFQQRPTLGQLRQEIGKLRGRGSADVAVGDDAAVGLGFVKQDHVERKGLRDGIGGEGSARGSYAREVGREGLDPEIQRQMDEHRARRRAEGSLYFT
jgi:hypothetical protein